MKKILHILLFSLSVNSLSAQIEFCEMPAQPGTPDLIAEFTDLTNGDIAFCDVDNDGDQDALITGSDGTKNLTELYLNDGTGNFSKVSDTPFINVSQSAVEFADLDNDGDSDVIISGYTKIGSTSYRYTRIYGNDGTGVFSYLTSLAGVSSCDIAVSDVNNDGNKDILISGYSSSLGRISKLYTNDGTGVFTEITETPFTGVSSCAIGFSDIDNDGDQDVLITGSTDSLGRISKLYTNNGTGVFTEITETPFTGVSSCAIGFSDIDNDGDKDVLIAGDSDTGKISTFYANDGTGIFTEVTETMLTGIYNCAIGFSDIDNDGDEDVLIAGDSDIGKISTLYINDGTGIFTEESDTEIIGVGACAAAFADVNGDNFPDLLINGGNGSLNEQTSLYCNDGTGLLIEVIGNPFAGVYNSSVAFADIDNDNDNDLVVTGYNGDEYAALYRNNGSGYFHIADDQYLWKANYSSVAFSDFNNDGSQDLLVTGVYYWYDYPSVRSSLYINNGAGSLSQLAELQKLYNGSVAFTDIDNDGDEDILITGQSTNGWVPPRYSILYTNDGAGNFTYNSQLTGVTGSSAAFSDVDNDGDQDVLITGSSTAGRVSTLYTNDGTGVFTEVTGTPFINVNLGSVAFSDVDNDGDNDVLITGSSDTAYISKLYTNDGTGVFAEVPGTPFVGVMNSSVAFSDLDGDGYDELIITGRSMSGKISQLYKNDGSGNYVLLDDMPFVPVDKGSVAFSDVDGDGDNDLLITGTNNDLDGVSILYQNLTCIPDTTDDIQTACDTYIWIDGNTYTSSNNTATFTMTNIHGCDSVVRLDLTVNYSQTSDTAAIACDNFTWYGNIYTESGDYTETFQSVAGCDSIVTLHLTINQTQYGDTAAAACDVFNWYGTEYGASGDYTKVLTASTGCDSIVTLHLSINTVTVSVIQDGASLTAEENGAEYQWINCSDNTPVSGAIEQSFTASENGTYAVIVDKGVCTDTSACYDVTGLGLSIITDQIRIYPNPSSGVFKLEGKNIRTVSVTDLTGKLILEQTIKGEMSRIDLSGNPSGVYFMEIRTEKGIRLKKIMLQ
jgi:hypothetical protein